MLERLKAVAGRVAENLLVSLIVLALAAGTPIALAVLAGDVTLPAWLVATAAVLLVAAGHALSRIGRSPSEREQLLVYLDGELELNRYYAEHLYEVLEILQRALAEDLLVTYQVLIDHGILQPARDLLTGEDEIRLSVLVPDEQHQQFSMAFAAGHSLEGLQQFSLPIAGSFSGLTLSRGQIHWSNDVANDPRYEQHPRARPGREYGSLVSVPIKVGEQSVAVMNVLSTSEKAFGPSDLTYIMLLGSILSVVWALMADQDDDDSSAG